MLVTSGDWKYISKYMYLQSPGVTSTSGRPIDSFAGNSCTHCRASVVNFHHMLNGKTKDLIDACAARLLNINRPRFLDHLRPHLFAAATRMVFHGTAVRTVLSWILPGGTGCGEFSWIITGLMYCFDDAERLSRYFITVVLWSHLCPVGRPTLGNNTWRILSLLDRQHY